LAKFLHKLVSAQLLGEISDWLIIATSGTSWNVADRLELPDRLLTLGLVAHRAAGGLIPGAVVAAEHLFLLDVLATPAPTA